MNTKTFQDYANNVFLPYIQSQLQHVLRLDVVWDVYKPESLKEDTRSKRGKGIRRRVEASSIVPRIGEHFYESMKTKQSCFLSVITSYGKAIIATCLTEVLCNNHRDVSGLTPCTHRFDTMYTRSRHTYTTPSGRCCETAIQQSVVAVGNI